MIGSISLLAASVLLAQAMVYPEGEHRPTLEETRAAMGIPSSDRVRGQRDTVGYASTAEQMQRTWDLAKEPPAPDRLGQAPASGVIGAIAPHDDYLYAGRVYRTVLPLVTAKTVIVIGVFHQYRKYRVRDRIVFDTYEGWRSPDGPVAISPIRDELFAAMPEGDAIRDQAAHDAEHSVEAEVYWLRHANPSVEIVPILVPATRFERLEEIATRLGDALAASMKKRQWKLGRDLAIVISADAVHYGPDFHHVPFGDGGIEAYAKAIARDREILTGPIAGPLSLDKIRTIYSTFVDPAEPDTYRVSWCGRFSIPLGMLVLRRSAQATGMGIPQGAPLAYATSVGAPELRLRDVGLGETAPANLYHFVGYPAAVWVVP